MKYTIHPFVISNHIHRDFSPVVVPEMITKSSFLSDAVSDNNLPKNQILGKKIEINGKTYDLFFKEEAVATKAGEQVFDKRGRVVYMDYGFLIEEDNHVPIEELLKESKDYIYPHINDWISKTDGIPKISAKAIEVEAEAFLGDFEKTTIKDYVLYGERHSQLSKEVPLPKEGAENIASISSDQIPKTPLIDPRPDTTIESTLKPPSPPEAKEEPKVNAESSLMKESPYITPESAPIKKQVSNDAAIFKETTFTAQPEHKPFFETTHVPNEGTAAEELLSTTRKSGATILGKIVTTSLFAVVLYQGVKNLSPQAKDKDADKKTVTKEQLLQQEKSEKQTKLFLGIVESLAAASGVVLTWRPKNVGTFFQNIIKNR